VEKGLTSNYNGEKRDVVLERNKPIQASGQGEKGEARMR